MAKIQNKHLPFVPEELALIRKLNDPMLNLYLATGIRRSAIFSLMKAKIENGSEIFGDRRGWVIKEKNGEVFVPYHPMKALWLEKIKPTMAWISSEKTINNRFKACAKYIQNLYGVKIKINPHRFRATFITRLISAGVDLITIQTLVGHAKLEMTAKYAKINQTMLSLAADMALDPDLDDTGNNIYDLHKKLNHERLINRRLMHIIQEHGLAHIINTVSLEGVEYGKY